MNPLGDVPVFLISKGRHDCCLTAKCFVNDGVKFRLVVEPQERHLYERHFPAEIVTSLPFSNLGLGSIPARNWCWETALSEGYSYHWILDDNIHGFMRRFAAKRVHCHSSLALRAVEAFVSVYDKLAISGMNYAMFSPDDKKLMPYTVNAHVYSNLLIDNSLPFRWRGRYNEDTDLCLQAISRGYQTLLVNAFTVKKVATMRMKGGNTAELYAGDGRLKMARSLERLWPGVVSVQRRWGRPQHVINWKRFSAPLVPKKNASALEVDLGSLKKKGEIKSQVVKEIFEKVTVANG